MLRKQSLLLTMLLVPVAACVLQIGAAAQQPGKALADKASQDALLDEIAELDVLRSLTPLKLTADQIDKMLIAIDQSHEEYDKRMTEIGLAALAPLADEIHAKHKEMLKGAEPAKALDEKIKKALISVETKRDGVLRDSYLFLTGTLQSVLTKDQKAIAIQMEKDSIVRLGRKLDPNNKDAQYLTAYAVDVMVNFRRITPLLKQLKAAQ
jgi:hypothetical protein